MSWPETNDDAGGRSLANQDPLLMSFKMPPKTSRQRKQSETSTKENDMLDEIHDFSDKLRTTLAPQFDELTAKLSASLAGFNNQLDQFKAVHSQAQKMVEGFQLQVNNNETAMGGQLKSLSNWKSPGPRIEEMKLRVEELKQMLASSKERLINVDRLMKEAEAEDQLRLQQVKIAGRTGLVILAVLLAIIWRIFWR